MDLADCCDNYIYKYIHIGQVLKFDLYCVITKLEMRYEKMWEYPEFELSTEHDCLYITNLQNLKIMAKQTFIYETALDNFAL